MWPVVMAALRSRAPFVTLPFAAVIGECVVITKSEHA